MSKLQKLITSIIVTIGILHGANTVKGSVSGKATVSTNEQIVIDLFIAAYGRAPTKSGLEFFVNKLDKGEMSARDIANYMVDTKHNPEAATRFPEDVETSKKVNEVFKHVLGREVATQEGLEYWSNRVDNNPDYTIADLIFDVLNSAKEHQNDKQTLEHKSEAVLYFLNSVPEDKQAGHQIKTDDIVTYDDVLRKHNEVLQLVMPINVELSEDNINDLAFMGNEERLAYDVYMYLYNYHNSNGNTIKQFYNIATKSETKHIQRVRELVNKYNISENNITIIDNTIVANSNTLQSQLPAGKYDIKHIQELYDLLIEKGKKSVQDALEVGCMVEVTDINDLNPKIDNAIASGAKDLEDAFIFLRNGSYNHYWAFDRGLKKLGIEAGCCTLGDDYCHPEYPKNESK